MPYIVIICNNCQKQARKLPDSECPTLCRTCAKSHYTNKSNKKRERKLIDIVCACGKKATKRSNTKYPNLCSDCVTKEVNQARYPVKNWIMINCLACGREAKKFANSKFKDFCWKCSNRPRFIATYQPKPFKRVKCSKCSQFSVKRSNSKYPDLCKTCAAKRITEDFRSANKIHLSEYGRLYKKEHAEANRAKQNRRRVLKLNAPGSHTESEWKAKCEEYGKSCIDCGSRSKLLTRGHAFPLFKGGCDHIENLIPQCSSCNSSQGVKIHPSATKCVQCEKINQKTGMPFGI